MSDKALARCYNKMLKKKAVPPTSLSEDDEAMRLLAELQKTFGNPIFDRTPSTDFLPAVRFLLPSLPPSTNVSPLSRV